MFQDDSRLLTEARHGNESSFLSLYRRYRTPLYRFAWRLIGSTAGAEDVVQDCFVAILGRDGFLPQRGGLCAYLFGIVRNLAFERLRTEERESDPVEESALPGGPFDDLLAAERSAAIARAISELPPLQREALVLFTYEELSLDEIAQVAGVETGAVKARLHRAREALRRRLAPLVESRAQRSCS